MTKLFCAVMVTLVFSVAAIAQADLGNKRSGDTLVPIAGSSGEMPVWVDHPRPTKRRPLGTGVSPLRRKTPDLTSQKWLLKSINGKTVNLDSEIPFLNFDAEKKSAGGNTGCNVFGGTYETDGSKIKFSEIISTMRACEFDDRMTIERGFLDGLRKADRFEIKGRKLFIYKGDTLVLEFEGTEK